MADLPQYYFRVRENGALVFRLDGDARSRRIEMEPIATVNTRNGEIRAQGERRLSPADQAEIGRWLAARREVLAARDVDDILRTVDHLNLTAHWALSRAADDQLEAVTDALLLAMHDLRGVLIRRRAERLEAGGGGAG